MDKTERIQELENEIQKHRKAYYNDQPLISDEAYDALEDELRELAPDHPLLEKVGAEPPEDGWTKISHRFFLSSLGKARNPSELQEWKKRVFSSLSNPPDAFSWSEKLDGISLALNYNAGELEAAVTRGDGTEGENILPNAVLFNGVQRQLRTEFSGTIRGEVVLPIDAWERHLPEYSNPRNAASGIARVESREDASNLCPHLKFFAYDILATNPPYQTEEEKFLTLEDWGFKVPNYGVDLTLDELIQLHERYQTELRNQLHYEIDGLVIRVPERSQYRSAGQYSNRPLGAVALKFPNEGKATTLRDVQWEVGNTGRITPVAHFDPVEIVGAEIQQASLYNASYIEELNLYLGDEIYVERANEVIPRVEEKLAETGSEKVNPPEACPACGGTTTWDGEYLLCSNKDGCPAQSFGDLKRWIESLGVLEWGDFVLTAVLEEDLVDNPADLYELDASHLADLQNENDARLGEKRARKILEELEKNKEPTVSEFLGGLNIPSLRKKTASKIVSYLEATLPDGTSGVDVVREALNMSASDLTSISGIGDKTAENILRGFRENASVVGRLISAGVSPQLPGGELEGLTFCITGSLSRTRAEVESDIEKAGGTMTGVRQDLDYLITNNPDSTSNKAKKARKYDVPFISEEELNEMLGGG